MLRAVSRRLLTGLATLLLVTLIVFSIIQMAPGGPLAGDPDREGLHRQTPEDRARLLEIYRLDRSLPEQYLLWIGDLLRGDLGRSFHDRRPVAEKIGERIGLTATLNALALLLMVGLSIPLGTLAALRPGSRWDRASALGTYLLYAIPVFWAGLLLQMAFAVRLDWLPLAGVRSQDWEYLGPISSGIDRLAHLVLPVICMTYGGLAYLSRFVRASLLDNAAIESWRAARARGLSSAAVLCRHGLRQAGVPMLTLAGLLLPSLVGGSVIVETIFALPGLGRLFVDAAVRRDLPVLMGLTLLSGVATLVGVILADLAYAWVDPRIRRSGDG